MTLEEIVEHQAEALLRAVKDLRETKNWRDKLSRQREVMGYWRVMEVTIERLKNKIQVDFKRQTGNKAVTNFWEKWKEFVEGNEKLPAQKEPIGSLPRPSGYVRQSRFSRSQ